MLVEAKKDRLLGNIEISTKILLAKLISQEYRQTLWKLKRDLLNTSPMFWLSLSLFLSRSLSFFVSVPSSQSERARSSIEEYSANAS